ncbi:MAG: hypothetical protein M1360_04580 [Candidatus Marsarchaeota archaeon]|jgi:hypothetical protein|nr:hypothetical protein [Candidatus Marsarchaeota archaeon]MCL5419182.1 hypothetical protein [Candidatus Marsarchaeota archaeon]
MGEKMYASAKNALEAEEVKTEIKSKYAHGQIRFSFFRSEQDVDVPYKVAVVIVLKGSSGEETTLSDKEIENIGKEIVEKTNGNNDGFWKELWGSTRFSRDGGKITIKFASISNGSYSEELSMENEVVKFTVYLVESVNKQIASRKPHGVGIRK